MANIFDSIDGNTETVGPAATSGSGSIMDAQRSEDFGQVSATSPQDMAARARGAKPPQLNSFEKMSAFQRAADGANAAIEADKGEDAQRSAALSGYNQVANNPKVEATATKTRTAGKNIADPKPDEYLAKVQDDIKKQMDYKSNVTLGDQLGAASMEMTVTGSLVRMMIDKYEGTRTFAADPKFNSLEGRETWGNRLSQEDLEWVSDAQSPAERAWKLDQLDRQRESYRVIGAHGDGVASLVGLTAGLADPAGWAAGMGVGKVAQLARTGVTLSRGMQALSGAAEGVAGNVLATATMEAAGDHITPGDYFYAAGFGALFGTAMSGAHRRARGEPVDPAADLHAATVENAAKTYTDGTLKFHAGILEEAQVRAGDNAKPEDIAAAAREVYNERAGAYFRQGTQPVNERILPDFDYEALYGQARPAAKAAPEDTGELPTIPNVYNPTATIGEKLEQAAANATGADYQLKDGTPVKARILVDHNGERTVQLTSDGRNVGSIAYGTKEEGINPDIEVVPEFRRKGAGTMLYDLAAENGGWVGDKISTQALRTEDGNAIRNVYEPGQSKAYRRKVEEPAEPELAGTLSKEIEGQFNHVDLRNAVGSRYGITADTVPDNAKRLIMQETLLRVEQNMPQFDERKLKNLISSWIAPIADSKAVANFSMPQHILARSEHPIMRWVAGHLLESPTQNNGPRTTAAVEHAIREREYNSFVARYNESYSAWRDQNGGSVVKDTLGKHDYFERFNKLVSEARSNRAASILGDEHPLVARAADAMDEGYKLLADHQRGAKTLGSSNLPESSRGYTPRHINSRLIEENPMVREALRKEVHAQLHELWKDFTNGNKLAREVAADYINRVRVEGAGGVSSPGHVSDPHAAPNIRDALAQHNLSEADLDRYMQRISRGGAKQTKHRLDLDLDKTVQLADGSDFRLADAFIQDQTALFRAQSRRVNGDVTLTRRGIFGKQGVDQLRELLVLSRKGSTKDKRWANELNAFDQTMSEFLGRPYGTTAKLADNLRVLTGASRLGQAVLPQLAETASMASQLGTEFAFRFSKELPRLVSEVRSGKTNPLLHSIELPGGTIGDNQKYVVPWQSFDDVQLAGKDAAGTMDRILRGAATAQFTLTGHRYLQAAQVRGVSEQILHKVFRFAKEGKNDSALRSMGMTPELIKAIKADMKNIAEFGPNGELTALDVRQTDNPAAMHEMVQVIERGSNQIIQGNFIGERQAYLHDSWLRLLAQFRSYSLTAMSKQWTRTRVDQGTAKAVGLLMGQMAFALPIHLARVGAVAALMSPDRRSEYLDRNLSPDMLGRATLNYATLSGSLGDILDGGMGMLGMEMSGVRSGNQSVLGNVPALGYVTNTAQALKDKDVSGIIKAMPGGNSLFLLPAVNLTHWMQKE